jgi:2-polyprenyl-3-methyl-5-hydroxy-6-metoxy-1,4-benzoquinol methylase
MARLECVKCNLCKSDDAGLIYKKNRFNIVKCRRCGLVYVNPRIKPDTLKNMYNEGVISPFNYYVKHKKEDELTFRKRMVLIEKYRKKGKLLDVGCSIGTFLDVAKKKGWDVYGIDINKRSIDYCRKKLGLNAEVKKLEEVKEKNFDVIIMNDILEHVADPLKILKIANSILKNKGILFIATPNIGSFLSKLTGKRWLHLKPDEHIYYFTPKTIRALLEKAGFTVVSCKSLGRVRNLGTVAYKSQTYSKIPYKILKFLNIDKLLNKISFSLNPFDEMGIIAVKRVK